MATISRAGSARRPMCPYCEYDLSGTFDRVRMRFVRCPECGEEMESHEVRWTRRPGDWTLATGLRNAALFLVWRGAVVVLILIAAVLSLEAFGSALNRASPGFQFRLWTLAIVQLPAGILAGRALMRGFEDAAGFSSLLLPFMATATLVAAAVLTVTALAIAPLPGTAPLRLVIFGASAVAAIVIVYDYMTELA